MIDWFAGIVCASLIWLSIAWIGHRNLRGPNRRQRPGLPVLGAGQVATFRDDLDGEEHSFVVERIENYYGEVRVELVDVATYTKRNRLARGVRL